jgi:hypothetical protein
MKLTIEITPKGTKRVFEIDGKIFEEYECVTEFGSKTIGKSIEAQLEESDYCDELTDLIEEGFGGDQYEIMMHMNYYGEW